LLPGFCLTVAFGQIWADKRFEKKRSIPECQHNARDTQKNANGDNRKQDAADVSPSDAIVFDQVTLGAFAKVSFKSWKVACRRLLVACRPLRRISHTIVLSISLVSFVFSVKILAKRMPSPNLGTRPRHLAIRKR
jgi:hypothetical protein